MPYDEPDDDEDWYDDDDEPDDVETGPLSGVRRPGPLLSPDKCPACGYWLSDADRRVMWTGVDNPVWIKVTAAIVLIVDRCSVCWRRGVGVFLIQRRCRR